MAMMLAMRMRRAGSRKPSSAFEKQDGSRALFPAPEMGGEVIVDRHERPRGED
jgi:hypothetical protein